MKNFPTASRGKIVIVGHCPKWLSPDLHIFTKQEGGEAYKFHNLTNNILTACDFPSQWDEDGDRRTFISDPFIIMNDDFYVMRKIDPHDIPNYTRESLMDGVYRYNKMGMYPWARHMRKMHMDSHKHQAKHSFEVHAPMVVYKTLMSNAILKAGIGPCWRTAYGAEANLEPTLFTDWDDAKIRRAQSKQPTMLNNMTFLSSSPDSFARGWLGEHIRKTFPKPTKYEV